MSSYREAVMSGHRTAALVNDNASSLMVKIVASCGGTFGQALTAALTTLGETHGPVHQARRVIFGDLSNESIEEALVWSRKIPGWGNAFFKGSEGDPAWKDAREILIAEYPDIWAKLLDITGRIAAVTGHELAPNAAAYTAVLAQIEKLPDGGELSIFIEARTGPWSEIYAQSFKSARLLGSA